MVHDMPRITRPTTPPSTATRDRRQPDNIWDALSTPASKPAPGWKPKPAATGRAKYTSADQKKALAECDAVVKALKAGLAEAVKKNPQLKGITSRSITVDTLGDFPYVAVKKNGVPLTDRHFEVDALRKTLPANLRRVPIGDISPF